MVNSLEKEDIMCVPHGLMHTNNHSFEKKDKEKKHIVRVSQKQFEQGDSDFIDERTTAYEPKKEESFFDSLFKD